MAKTKKSDAKDEKNVKNVSNESKVIKKKVKPIVKANDETKKEQIVKSSKKKNADTKVENNAEHKNLGKEKPTKSKNESLLEKVAKKKAKKIAQKLKKKQAKKVMKTKEVKGGNNKKVAEGEPEKMQESEVTKTPQKKNLGKKLLKKAENAKNESENAKHNYNDPALLAATIFVGNLPITTKRAQIVRHFNDYAPIKTVRFRTANGKKIFKQKMRKDAGSLIAYLVLKNEEVAERALALNNSEFKGNHLRVTRAAEKGSIDNKCTVVVGNLKYSATEDKLREIFSSCGEIEYIRCLQANPKDIAAATNKDIKAGCKGVAYVCFKSPESVGLALELKETMLDERPINVERYTNKKQGAMKARMEAAKLAEPAKKIKGGKNKKGDKSKTADENDEGSAEKKKSVYHGVKIDSIKKKQKKSSKNDKHLKAIAKKIAPKTILSK